MCVCVCARVCVCVCTQNDKYTCMNNYNDSIKTAINYNNYICNLILKYCKYRSCHQKCSIKKAVLQHFAIFTEKHLFYHPSCLSSRQLISVFSYSLWSFCSSCIIS